ncbi:MAG: aromatic ring-hydroxylating dioxygenase subunit alpha [Proteobacteria bacterium]|nr:aromatic ring-hydroxylating dioxygenase subunit alpha [Pseudomonadota bacterium]
MASAQVTSYSRLPDRIEALVRGHDKAGPMQRPFYVDPAIFDIDLERIWRRWWLFAGPSCAIPEAGDWFTYQVGTDSLIFVRGEDGEVRGFHNTCRHRGSRICNKETGHGARFVCPYHAWSYGLDGGLLFNPQQEFGLDRATLSLHPVQVRDAAGLLFFSLADDPPDFESACREISRRLKPHGMDRARVAKAIDYVVDANWKLIFENNRECYHCPSAHKEYTRATYDVARDAANSGKRSTEDLDAIVAAANARFRALGLDEGDTSSSFTAEFYRTNRTPLMKGFTTQSLDGKAVAPLMGDLKERDAGTLRITVYPNFWQHASDDHAVATRLTPLSATRTAARVVWLVHEDAVEGRDYRLDRLLPLWQLTSEQDWELCKVNQLGVSSSHYRPGRYSRTREQNVVHFVEWYLKELASPTAGVRRHSAAE